MKSPIGHTFIYNIIILFLVIVFAFLAGSMSYYKAFKVNNRIVSALEKYEGYNDLAYDEINRFLGSIGYYVGNSNHCSSPHRGMTSVARGNEMFRYCIYIGTEHGNDRTTTDSPNTQCRKYYQFGVVTEMSIDLPLINRIRLPIFTRTNRIYRFTTAGCVNP